ncbi:olfactory receptor 52E4-like [Pelodiscus sinensis]|uniref:olfactory receptor 52E4-like n=1 Tax=Pelodiscus sinensis TaxID=13735 RepID=UPI003F6ABCC4
MYAIALLGNFTILFIVKKEPSLHEPMYYFLCMLAVTDLLLSTSIQPKMLSIFWQWPYCRTNIIPHTYCEHLSVLKLACADTRISTSYGLFVLFFVTGLDVLFIIVSYTQILRAVFSLPTKDAWLKSLGTCSAHFSAILAFYMLGLFTYLTHRFGQNVAPHFHVLIASVYLLGPAMLNPIIYGVRTRQIRNKLLHLFSKKET